MLRIISMTMIIGLHYFGMGGALSNLMPSSYNYYVAHFFESTFIVGVNCFVLITGYFQINKNSIQISKVIEFLFNMLCYSLFFYAIAVGLELLPLTYKELAKAVFPFFRGLRWFIEIYIILYLFSPFLNRGLNQLNKREFKILLILMLLFFSIGASFLPNPPVKDNGYGIITFVLLYSIGAYIKKFYIMSYSKKALSCWVLCLCINHIFV